VQDESVCSSIRNLIFLFFVPKQKIVPQLHWILLSDLEKVCNMQQKKERKTAIVLQQQLFFL